MFGLQEKISSECYSNNSRLSKSTVNYLETEKENTSNSQDLMALASLEPLNVTLHRLNLI